MRSAVHKAAAAAGLERAVTPYDLRATFAAVADYETKDLLKVQSWLGHADVNVTQGYVTQDAG